MLVRARWRIGVPEAVVLIGIVFLAAGLRFLGIDFGLPYEYHLNDVQDVRQLNVLWLPFCLLVAVATVLGASLWLAALNVQIRDVRYAIPFLVQA